MLDKIESACDVTSIMLKQNGVSSNPTEEDLKKAADSVASMMMLTDDEKELVIKKLQERIGVILDLGNRIVGSSSYHPWLDSRKASIDPYYWSRYEKYMQYEKHWPEQVVNKLGEVSDEILDLCGNPIELNPWRRKGLIIGDIQSGKTSNYLALANKAADAGYKVIILLTGTIESLRKQTQERVDAGFVGMNSRNTLQKNPQRQYIGVGQIDTNRFPASFTTVISDFNQQLLEANNFTIKSINEPVIFVVKKQRQVLSNLADWLSTKNKNPATGKIDYPLLLIDDESDNASVNTNKAEADRTAINQGICNILVNFSRATYIGVTATPFANIFIDADLDNPETGDFNLFPGDFIYSLNAPTNYIGADQIFSEGSKYADSLEEIDDVVISESAHEYVFRSRAKTAHIVAALPQSLKDALNYFMLYNTIQDLKGKTLSHRSMLINVSQYVAVQIQVYDLVNMYLKQVQRKVKNYSMLGAEEAETHEEIAELKKCWNNYKLQDKCGYCWEDALEVMNEAIAPIQMRLVNQKAKSGGYRPLDYEEYEATGLRVIAIGGNTLSRGLTLEGLAVSYFDRNSQMYDTLMQMGRWFGYRNGYENLFKVWMEPKTIDWYRYITIATDELKESVVEMQRLGLTPNDFGLKVQQNKTSLFVTASNKRRATTEIEQWVSLAADVVETPKLIANKERCLIPNLEITIDLLKKISSNDEYYDKSLNFSENKIVYSKIPNDIIAAYIAGFASHPRHLPFNSKDLSEYIRENQETWTVVLIGGSGEKIESEYFPESLNLPKEVHYSYRRILKDDSCLMISGKRSRVGAPGATRFGLQEPVIKSIRKLYEEMNPNVKTIPDKPYLRTKMLSLATDGAVQQRDPVLLIYPIKIDLNEKEHPSDNESIKLVGNMPIIGLTLGFPGDDFDKNSRKVKYILNRVADRTMIQFEEDDEDEE